VAPVTMKDMSISKLVRRIRRRIVQPPTVSTLLAEQRFRISKHER
jgi:hypothetical protein